MEIFDSAKFPLDQIEALIERIEKNCLAEEDYQVLASFIKSVDWLKFSLHGKKINGQYFRRIFSNKTESAKKLLKNVDT
jgi:hypothetical protein